MKCRVDGCEREATYKQVCLCQKHYFRLRRNGSVELKQRPARQYRITMPGKGYQRLYEPNHPLADSQGYVAEHRMVVFARVGYGLKECELCGKPVDWETVHIDHIDNNPKNNAPENLRPLCRPCNTFRDYPELHTISGRHAVTYNGKTLTPEEWAREPGVRVGGHVIRNRLKSGMSVQDAMFAPKKTHNGKPKTDSRPRKTAAKYQRSNAIAITIDGLTMTSAEWSRHSDCTVSDSAIRQRIKAGWIGKDAVFKPSKYRKDLIASRAEATC